MFWRVRGRQKAVGRICLVILTYWDNLASSELQKRASSRTHFISKLPHKFYCTYVDIYQKWFAIDLCWNI